MRAKRPGHTGLESPNASSGCGRSSSRWRPPPIRSISRRPPRFAPKPWRSFRGRSTSSPRSPESSRCSSSSARWRRKPPRSPRSFAGWPRAREKPVCVSWPSPPRAVPAHCWPSAASTRFVDPARGIRALVQAGRAWRRVAPTARGLRRRASTVRLAARSFQSTTTQAVIRGTHLPSHSRRRGACGRRRRTGRG